MRRGRACKSDFRIFINCCCFSKKVIYCYSQLFSSHLRFCTKKFATLYFALQKCTPFPRRFPLCLSSPFHHHGLSCHIISFPQSLPPTCFLFLPPPLPPPLSLFSFFARHENEKSFFPSLFWLILCGSRGRGGRCSCRI